VTSKIEVKQETHRQTGVLVACPHPGPLALVAIRHRLQACSRSQFEPPHCEHRRQRNEDAYRNWLWHTVELSFEQSERYFKVLNVLVDLGQLLFTKKREPTILAQLATTIAYLFRNELVFKTKLLTIATVNETLTGSTCS
jgi:hypothetical protein